MEILERKDIDPKYKWDFESIYPSMDAFKADLAAAEKMSAALAQYQKTMTRSGADLFAALEARTSLYRKIGVLYEYAGRHFDTDSRQNEWQSWSGKVMDLARRTEAIAFFYTPCLLRIDEETMTRFYAECPELDSYRPVLDDVFRRRPHTLSDAEEKVLAQVSQYEGTHNGIFDILADSDMRFGKLVDEDGQRKELTANTFIHYMQSRDRAVRRRAFTLYYKQFEQFRNTLSTIYNGYVKEMTTKARIRHFKNSLEASVFEDNVPSSIYLNLVKTVGENLEPLYRYYDIKRELLGVDQLHMYDLYPALIPAVERTYTYDEAVEEVLKTVEVFGKEYHDTLAYGLSHNWVDVYPNRGKHGGAYSGGCYDTQPLILLNFCGSTDDVSTLAHEAGHSMHSYFSRKSNPPQTADYTIFVAEVASTVNELLLSRRRLRESTSKEEKLAVLDALMDLYKGTLYRQTMFAAFEARTHALCEKGEPLTADLLCREYYKLVKKYFGPRVKVDRQIKFEWMRVPHFYYNFYVYKYATCISAASAIVRHIEAEGDAYISRYLDFLRCGGSKTPLDSLKVAGVDLTQPSVVEDAIAIFTETVDEFEKIYHS